MVVTGASTQHSERIDIAFGVDGNYAAHLAAVISSIRRNAPQRSFRFIILFEDFPGEKRRKLEAVAPGSEFCWVELNEARFAGFSDHEHFTRAIMFRLGLAELAPEDCKRVIYLDADLIVTSDIGELWQADLQGAAIGAVRDCFVDSGEFAGKWGLPVGTTAYFNSGVLLIDLEKARAKALFEKALAFVAQHGESLRFTDQDALNWAFADSWRQLDNRWNVQRHMVIPSLSAMIEEHLRLGGQKPGIVHFTGPEKPWLPDVYHPWAWIYWRALRGTGFEGEVAKRYEMTTLDKGKVWSRWARHRWDEATLI